MYVAAGTDTYGRVKTVSGTPIVTQFAMLQLLPVVPLQSFYYLGTGPVERQSIRLFASFQTASIDGIPLASVDIVSVLMAYIRALFGALSLLAFIPIFGISMMYLYGEHFDERKIMIAKVTSILLGIGVLGGLATYLIPLTPWREREIRRHCFELLGIAADPARVSADARVLIKNWLDETRPLEENIRTRTIRELIQTRLNVSQPDDKFQLEHQTDDLLDQLRKLEKTTT